MSIVRRWIVRFVARVVRHPVLTLAIAGALVAACAGLAATRLTVSSDQNALFSPKVPFFRDWLAFVREFPENEALYVLVQAKAPDATIPVERWAAAADAIAAAVRGLDAVGSVDARVPLDQLGSQGILFEDPARVRQEVEEARRFVPLAKLWGESGGAAAALLGRTPMERFLASLALAPADAETAGFAALLADSWRTALALPPTDTGPPQVGPEIPDLAARAATDPSRLGYYYVPDETNRSRHLLLVRVYPNVEHAGLTAVSDAVDSIRRAVAGAAAAFPEFQIDLTGRPALEADEMRTTDRDSHRSEVLALCAVFVGLVVAMRSIWLAAAAEIALAAGIGWTFGWATLTVGHLNLLSIVFLIALIGIGMDYIVQILSRYRQEIRFHGGPEAVWTRVFTHIGPPVNTACMGAAGAFLVSAFTAFRGAAELGIIAGGGLLLCLLSGYTVLPALLTLLPAKPRTPLADRPMPTITRASRGALAMPVVWLALLAAGVPFMLRAHFDPGLLSLQAQNLRSVQLVRKLQTWSAVVLSKDPDTLRRAREALRDSPVVASTESILSAYDNAAWLREHGALPAVQWAAPAPITPEDVPAIARRATAAAQRFESASRNAAGAAGAALERAAGALRAFAAESGAAPADLAAARLTAWQTGFVAQLREQLGKLAPGEPDLSSLPRELRSHYVSDRGLFALYIYPDDDLWVQENLKRFVADIDSRLRGLPEGTVVTGIAEDIYHSTRRIESAFHQSTAAALALILVLIFADLRSVGLTLAAVSVLALGLPMLVAIMGMLGVSWNFANFFGLPILIGAGHEYGVFMVHRYVEARDHETRAWGRWDVSDKALLMCAFVTSASFGFFWVLAHHLGLRSLGFVMAVGTACIYLAAVAVVRPVLRWRLARRRPGELPAAEQAAGPLHGQVRHDERRALR
jgi:predicted RND superfamily exporter protein